MTSDKLKSILAVFYKGEIRQDMKLFDNALNFYKERILSHLPNAGTYVYDESWDNLIILDACRYDTFGELNGIKGKLESRISRGSATQEFLMENFSKHPKYASFKDVVYVAANPFVSWLVPDKFYKIYPVWDYGWDDRLHTISPDIVVREALEAHKQHPDKRLIVHFMQPHFPSLDGKIQAETGITGMRKAALANIDASIFLKGQEIAPEHQDTNAPILLAKGKLTKQEVYSAYTENLKIVLSHVSDLVKMLPGTTVVSSDHGDLFGERLGILYPFKAYSHPAGLRLGALVKVPWLTIVNPKTKIEPTTNAVEQTGISHADEEKIKDRLQKLGYL